MGASASRYTIAQQPSDDRGKSRRKKLSSKGVTKVASAASTDRKKRHSSSASSRPATGSTTRRLTIASSAGIVNRVAKSDSRNTGSRRTPVDDFNTERSDRVKARAGRQQGGGGGGSSSDRSRRQATNGVEHQASWSFGGHRLLLGGNDSRSNRTGTNSKTFHSAGTDPGGRPRRDRAASADTSLSKVRPVSLPAGAHRSAMSTGGVPPKQERNWLGFRRNRGSGSSASSNPDDEPKSVSTGTPPTATNTRESSEKIMASGALSVDSGHDKLEGKGRPHSKSNRRGDFKIQRLGSADSRTSFRIRRQLSTYGELHDLVAKKKLGGGVIRGLVGLQNLGNTCFMNSALQCLVNCQSLADYFLGYDWRSEINRANFLGHKGLMAEALGNLAVEMWSTKKAFISPTPFKRQAGESMPLFAGYEQQDVQEFLAFLLDAVHEDLNRVPNAERKYVEAKEAKEGESEELVAREAWKGYLERNRSIIVDLFQGQLRSALQCGVCGKQSVSFDPFMYLSVPLPGYLEPTAMGEAEGGASLRRRKRGGRGGRGEEGGATHPGVSLEECIELFCEEETLEGDNAWYCPSCKTHQPATKKLDLWKVPPVLIVHLKRFAGSGKISSPVIFPLTKLDLSEVVKSPQKEPPDYDLFATANHTGSVYGGHYTACAQNRVSGQWNMFNDDQVDGLEPGEVQSASAYVLFYNKMCSVEEAVVDEGGSGTDDNDDEEVSENYCEDPTGLGVVPSDPDLVLRPAFAGAGAAVGAAAVGDGVDVSGRGARSKGKGPISPRKKSPVRSGAKREAAVVRRQSVSKPHNWPHLHHDGTFQPTLPALASPVTPNETTVPSSAIAADRRSAPVALPAVSSGSSSSRDPCPAVAAEAPGAVLTRRTAEQGYGRATPASGGLVGGREEGRDSGGKTRSPSV